MIVVFRMIISFNDEPSCRLLTVDIDFDIIRV
jgi:hypothetical protein